MPYGVSKSQPDCSGWATVKQVSDESFETVACHDSKQAALDQMVAVSISEKVEPIGDVTVRSRDTEVVLVDLDETLVTKSRYPIRDAVDAVNQLAHDVFIITGREEAQREQTLDDLQSAGIRYSELFMMPDIDMNIAQYKRDTVERLMDEYEIVAFVDDNGENRAAVESLGVYVMTPDEFVDAAFESGLFDIDVDMLEMREVNRVAPGFMAASARRGLRLHAEGYSGDGLMPATVADARRMAEGVALSADKWRRIPGWIARHLMDLDAVDGDEITPGLVAMLLWGGGSSKSSARRTQAYAERIVAQLDDDESRAQPRDPDGKFASTGGGASSDDDDFGDDDDFDDDEGVDMEDLISEQMANPTVLGAEANFKNTEKHQQNYVTTGLDANTKTTIEEYTGNDHKNINKSLRGAPPPPLNSAESGMANAQAATINAAISNAPVLPDEVAVYRGINAAALGIDVAVARDVDDLVGTSFVDKGIVSTSFNPILAKQFGNDRVVMAVVVPRGSKALSVTGVSRIPIERELLLPSNTKFTVISVKRPKRGNLADKTVIVVEADTKSAGELRYDPNQPRKPNGQFGSTGGASTSSETGSDTSGGGATADIGGTEAEYESTFTTLQNDQAGYIEELPGEQLESIVEYTSSAHYDINKHMRGAPPPPIENQDMIDSAERHAGLVNNAIHDAPSLSNDITVYRGIDKQVLGVKAGTSADTLDSSLTGAVFSDGGIISTSISSSEAKSFSDDSVVLAVRVPKGSKALYVDDISTHPGEREVLLPMDTEFKILGVQRPVTGKLKGQIVVSVEATTPKANIYEFLGL